MSDLRSVLFIEDNPGDVRLVREYLHSSLGDACELREAATLGDGLRDLRSQPVDLVLLDLSLSDSCGLDTLLRVQSEAPWTPVVVFTGSDDTSVSDAAMDIGAEDVLLKGDANSSQLVRSMQHAFSRSVRTRLRREAAWQDQTLAEHARDGLLVLDGNGLVVRANARVAALLGLPSGMQDRLIGQQVADLVHASHAVRLAALLDTQAPAQQHQQLLLQSTGGPSTWVMATAALIPGPGTWRGRAMLMLTELGTRPQAAEDQAHHILATELAERAETLRLQSLTQERYQHALAHDLRTPLNGILGYSVTLREELRAVMQPAQLRKFRVIEHSARLMASMVSSLLHQASNKAQPLPQETVDLSAVAEVVAATLEAAEPGRGVHWQIQPGMWAVGDSGLLSTLVANLLQNAWKYTSAADPATIAFRAEPGHPMVYRVVDNGIGFTAEESASLFQRFLRLPSAQGMEGLGIGLDTVQQIVQRHGGRVWAEGQPGRGASFYFTLGPDDAAVSSIP